MRRIAALVPNVLGATPGQRVRIETWAQLLPAFGWKVEFLPFEDAALHDVLYRPGRMAAKSAGLLRCYLRKLAEVRKGIRADVLFIYREAALVGPALLERLAARSGARVVYDIDDPIFLPYRSPVNVWFSLLKFSRKTHSLLRLANHVIAINGLIGDYAARFNPRVTVIPNFVDTDVYRPAPRAGSGGVRLGWIGSVSTVQNLASIAEPIRRLQARHPVPLRAIGVGSVDLPGVALERREWSAATEIAELQQCDIGLVPLLDLPWNPWKFFLKTVQYMALGLPVVARRMGSNAEVIRDGVDGFLVETADEWHDRLRQLVEDPGLRRRMGEEARRAAVERFSVQTQMPRVAAVFDQVLAADPVSRAPAGT